MDVSGTSGWSLIRSFLWSCNEDECRSSEYDSIPMACILRFQCMCNCCRHLYFRCFNFTLEPSMENHLWMSVDKRKNPSIVPGLYQLPA